MKKSGLLLTLAMIACTPGMSQHSALSEEYWVVETHTRDTVYSVVRFFDGNNVLLHEVRVENVAIDIEQKKHRKKLDQLLSEFKMRTANGAKKIRLKSSV